MMEIREFTELDASDCARIYLQGRRDAHFWLPAESFSLEDFETDTREEKLWVAEWATRVVGFVSVWVPDSFVHNLFVAPEAQRRGVASALLKQVAATVAAPLDLKCQVKNENACSFYARRGWREVERGKADLGEYIRFRWDGRVGKD